MVQQTQFASLEAKAFVDTQFGRFNIVAWSGRNTSGLRALCDKVIVLPDQAAETVGSIIIPDEIKANIGLAATTGILVSVGPQAFAYDSRRTVYWEGERPKAGDRVYFQKYSGQEHNGRDDLLYRIMDYSAIAAIDEPPSAADEAAA